jgi:hypothetical protein
VQSLRSLPDLSQFKIGSNDLDLSALEKLPPWTIILLPERFPVTWDVENPDEGSITIYQENTAPQDSVEEAWRLLHHDHPRLFGQAITNYRGELQPGTVIQAEVKRESVPVTAQFQVRYESNPVLNIWSWEVSKQINVYAGGPQRRVPSAPSEHPGRGGCVKAHHAVSFTPCPRPSLYRAIGKLFVQIFSRLGQNSVRA